MNTRAWTEEDRDEYDAMCAEAWESSSNIRDQVAAFLAKLADARQAHRDWAYRVEDEVLRAGARERLKEWSKTRSRVLVAYSDGAAAKPRVIGTTRTDAAGNRVHQQVLFETMTWQELAEKRVEYLKQIKAYGQNVGLIDRLLALHDLAPESATPAAAARLLGTTIEDWLAEDAA